MARASVHTPWALRGTAMRQLVEAAGPLVTDTVEGVRIREADGSWALAVPDEVESVIRLWAEAESDEAAEDLLARWFGVIETAVA